VRRPVNEVLGVPQEGPHMEFVDKAFSIFEVLDVADEYADSDPPSIFSFETF